MQVYSINPEDARNVLSFTHAMQKGYRITLDSDGCAQIENGRGDIYHVEDWVCDCPDSISRAGGSYERSDGSRFCKHVAWVSQIHPCDNCNATMILHTLGDGIHFFSCYNCKSIKSGAFVKFEREKHRQQETALTLERAEEASSLVFGH